MDLDLPAIASGSMEVRIVARDGLNGAVKRSGPSDDKVSTGIWSNSNILGRTPQWGPSRTRLEARHPWSYYRSRDGRRGVATSRFVWRWKRRILLISHGLRGLRIFFPKKHSASRKVRSLAVRALAARPEWRSRDANFERSPRVIMPCFGIKIRVRQLSQRQSVSTIQSAG
jgi:hypothetical protein